ncbi:uncharacterized protein LOC129220780 [Uloborus diversus]|uniref:uncharacterized protein LOC129220780 n=1 Tax=Uloborus diversus TaxID=327109 RepID=UPI0024097B5E|nr:uncharacterized protein LOC129220780 [Uloborus diversus]
MQRPFLLKIAKCFISVSTDALNVLTGIPHLHVHLKYTAITFKTKRLRINSVLNDHTLQADDYELTSRNQHNYNSNLHQFILPLTITESNDDFTINIYTDSSKTDAGTACAFIAMKEMDIIFSSSKTLRPNNSAFQAEIQAIHLAIDWIQDHFSMDHFANNKFHIRSDSLSAIKALLNYEPKSMVIFQLQSKLINLRHIVSISWIKGHSNNSGNDFAD